MLINYKKPKAGILNVSYKEKAKEEETAERRAHRKPKFVSIIPGISEVSDSIWNKIKDHSMIVSYRDQGWIVLPHAEVIKPKKEGGKEKELTTKVYKDLSGKEQEALIRDCENIKQLKKWKKSTKESASALLNDKIDRVEHPEKYADTDED